MAALAESGVPFRMIAHSNGEIECWRQPKLEPWETPRRDPAEPRPSAPELAAQRRETQRRWRERQRIRKAGQQSCGRGSGSFSNVVRDRRWRPLMPR
jgi:hypothetical protein